MVNVTRIPIKSKKSSEHPGAWFEIDFNGESIRSRNANCGGVERPQSTRIPINYGLTRQHPEPDRLDARWVYGIDLDGNYFFKHEDDVGSVIMAHLAFYYPAEDRLEILEFIEDGVPAE